jgi:hypothetical protein
VSFRKLGILIACLAVSLPLGAGALSFEGGTYYIGLEDQYPNSDYDYNDLIFTLTGNNQVTLNASTPSGTPTFSAPIVPNNTPPPFWDNFSLDSTLPPFNPNDNFGECLYVTGNGCTAGGNPLAPSAYYLNDGSGGQVNFSFSAPVGTLITLNLLAAVNDTPTDVMDLYICYPDPAVTNCNLISPSGGTYLVGGDGTFDLAFYNPKTTDLFDSNLNTNAAFSSVGGLTDSGIDHFALAMTPEPGTLAVVGTVLVGLGLIRRQRNKKR